jgi:hypothetical protein
VITISVLLILAAAVPFATADKPAPPEVDPIIAEIGSANVDGDTTFDWDTDTDFFAPLYIGWNQNGKDEVAGNAYIQYEPGTKTVYVFVDVADGSP